MVQDDISLLVKKAGIDLSTPRTTNPFEEVSSLLKLKYDLAESRILAALRDGTRAAEERLKTIYTVINDATIQARQAARQFSGYSQGDKAPLQQLADTLQAHYGQFAAQYERSFIQP